MSVDPREKRFFSLLKLPIKIQSKSVRVKPSPGAVLSFKGIYYF